MARRICQTLLHALIRLCGLDTCVAKAGPVCTGQLGNRPAQVKGCDIEAQFLATSHCHVTDGLWHLALLLNTPALVHGPENATFKVVG
jgi:hypothetical protein